MKKEANQSKNATHSFQDLASGETTLYLNDLKDETNLLKSPLIRAAIKQYWESQVPEEVKKITRSKLKKAS